METGLRRALRHLPHVPQQRLLPLLARESVLSHANMFPEHRAAASPALGTGIRCAQEAACVPEAPSSPSLKATRVIGHRPLRAVQGKHLPRGPAAPGRPAPGREGFPEEGASELRSQGELAEPREGSQRPEAGSRALKVNICGRMQRVAEQKIKRSVILYDNLETRIREAG